ncbi:hypothetical protein ACQPXM_30835 [Kribbella sp. CA-253562]|uniref:hypothetical protein n=1 Tax=Kribbella sp. CA-253562 TaxID=3239942 RepID=UPI003D933573
MAARQGTIRPSELTSHQTSMTIPGILSAHRTWGLCASTHASTRARRLPSEITLLPPPVAVSTLGAEKHIRIIRRQTVERVHGSRPDAANNPVDLQPQEEGAFAGEPPEREIPADHQVVNRAAARTPSGRQHAHP